MARRGIFKTIVDDVCNGVREEILSGALHPGQRLRVGELSTRLDVSANVIREALTRLSAQHLVASEPQRGFSVMSLSIGTLQDLTLTRQVVDGLALRLAIERGDMEWETNLVAIHHRLASIARDAESVPRSPMPPAWNAAHANFHRALISGARAEQLLTISEGLWDASEVYRRWSVPAAAKYREPGGEHERILNAALERDADGAVALLTEHYETTAELLICLPEASASLTIEPS